MTKKDFNRIIREARQHLKMLAKIYPGAFDKNGKPIVATLTLPEMKR